MPVVARRRGGTVSHGAGFQSRPSLQRRNPVGSLSRPRTRGATATTQASSSSSNELGRRDRKPDPFAAAGLRLQNLLSGVGDGEEELLQNMLSSEPAETKLLLSLLSGGVITVAALGVCWLCGTDPTGGMSVSASSLEAAGLGAVAALPLIALKLGLWSEQWRRSFPALDDAHRSQVEHFTPLISNMTPAQVSLVMLMEVLPTVLLVLPAAQGGLTASFSLYASHMHDIGLHLPEQGPSVLALVLTAFLASLARLIENSVSGEEYAVVEAAMRNADRYYRLMSGPHQDDADKSCIAFKSVAATWLNRKKVAGSFTAVLTAFEVVFLGILWRETGDLAAPLTAAMLSYSVDFAQLHKSMLADSQHSRSRG
ncbi:hypothetical protein WJX72_009864 [[Myrmecia] bisecta]|uniref:Uncharacterized protein n=1 Tax=[Myrmecia] bisecta TaxID=41462 RepID=A0AAW1PX07_9CHLO